ncbi:MAG: hypothetical protein H6718_00010 [Polyangiaceae bacterium]|nr:hypothetical protein [Polyangiaceae bacterium]MCB9610710.1 hypothetical protein [Polyangiaceae bacterium]
MPSPRYRQAVISYCPNLRDPFAPSIPLCVLTVAEEGRRVHAVAVGSSVAAAPVDPLTKEILGDVPDFVSRHLISSADQQHGMNESLRALVESLRNSVHVSEVTEECPVPNENDTLEVVLHRLSATKLRQAFAATLKKLEDVDLRASVQRQLNEPTAHKGWSHAVAA